MVGHDISLLEERVDDDFEDASPIHKNIQIARRDLGVLRCCGAFTLLM